MTTRYGRGAVRLLAVLVVAGVAACTAATPDPSPSPASAAPAAEASGTPSVATASPSASVAPSREPSGDLGRELRIGKLGPAWTERMLEFASDGLSVIYSSGAMDGSDGEFAPDLWRYQPAADAPELLWSNPRRDRSLVRIGGEFRTWAFVDMPLSGEIAWDFWLLPEAGAEPILLDSHPGDAAIPDFVPSFVVHMDQVAWTSFDAGPAGAVSQLLYARAPDWHPVVLVERDASAAELWMPSLRDTQIAYCEVVYSPDRSTDERHVYIADAAHPETAPRRLDTSGRATMPILLINGGVVWKEADPGFSMFNWGHLFHYDEESGAITSLPMRPQEYVNYPSAGSRFVAAWGADSRALGVYDLDLDTTRLIDRWPPETGVSIARPHLSWDMLVWLSADEGGDQHGLSLRFAYLPVAGADRSRD